jgi:hypothetical protein
MKNQAILNLSKKALLINELYSSDNNLLGFEVIGKLKHSSSLGRSIFYDVNVAKSSKGEIETSARKTVRIFYKGDWVS